MNTPVSIRNEADRWGREVPCVTTPQQLEALRHAFERSAIVVEHRFYRGSRSPDRMVFDDYDTFREYLRTHAQPGDSFWFWSYDDVCRDDNPLAHAKFPDSDGTVPAGGAY